MPYWQIDHLAAHPPNESARLAVAREAPRLVHDAENLILASEILWNGT